MTDESVEARAMVYVIEGDIVLVSRSVLEMLGCIPNHFPRVGEFLEPDDKDLTGKLFAINPHPTGWMSDGTHHGVITPDNNTDNSDEVKIVNEAEAIKPQAYNYKPGVKPVVRQPKGECDPESELPCSCPRRDFVDPPEELSMSATDSNRKALEEFIKEHYKLSAFNTCKRQHWPVTSGPPMKIHTPDEAVRTYCRKVTKVPLHFRDEVKAGLEADVKKGVLERVPMGEPETWCSHMVIQPKKNGRAGLAGMSPTIQDQLQRLPSQSLLGS